MLLDSSLSELPSKFYNYCDMFHAFILRISKHSSCTTVNMEKSNKNDLSFHFGGSVSITLGSHQYTHPYVSCHTLGLFPPAGREKESKFITQ